MKKINYLNKKGEKYLFRIRVPADLRNRLGKKELKRSLKTANIQIAKRRVSQLLFLATTLFDQLRMNAHLTQAEVQELGREFYNTRLLEDIHARTQHSEQYPIGKAPAPCRKQSETEILKFQHLLSTCDIREIRPQAEKILNTKNITPTDRELTLLCVTLLRAELEAAKQKLDRDNGVFYGSIDDPIFDEENKFSSFSKDLSSSKNTEEICGKTPRDFMEDLISQREGMSRKEVSKFKKAAEIFEEICGSRDLSEYKIEDARKYRNTLQSTPIHFKNHFKNKNIFEAIKKNKCRKKPIATLTAARINSGYLSPLKQLFELYHSDFNTNSSNIFEKIRVNKGKQSTVALKKARLPFTEAQLGKLFYSPLFTGFKSKKYKSEPGNIICSSYLFWLPLFMAFTGVRPNELGQAEISDVIFSHGYPCLSITNGTDDDEPDTEKSLKTSAARRTIPIHEVLIEKGFLKHIEKMKKQGHKRLFPDWKIACDKTYSANPSKVFNRDNGYLDKLGIKSKKNVLYSLRHNFKDLLKFNGIGEDAQDLLMGHENSRVSTIYGDPNIHKTLIEKVRSLQYQEVDFSIIPQRK